MDEHRHFYPDDAKALNFRPHFVFSGVLNCGGNWSNGMHDHGFCEIMHITGGSGVTRTDRGQFPFKAGDIVVYNSGVSHEEWSLSDELSILFFAVDNLNIQGFSEGCLIPENASPVIEAGSYDSVLQSFLSVMQDEITHKNSHYKAISTSIATIFCYYILRLYDIKIENPHHTDLCGKAKKFIEDNYRSDISLDKISGNVHMSKHHFVRIFKEVTSISPMKYLLDVRLNAAKELLGKTDKTIKEIAEDVGYENALTFSRVFKNSENISPTEYRKRATDFTNFNKV